MTMKEDVVLHYQENTIVCAPLPWDSYGQYPIKESLQRLVKHGFTSITSKGYLNVFHQHASSAFREC